MGGYGQGPFGMSYLSIEVSPTDPKNMTVSMLLGHSVLAGFPVAARSVQTVAEGQDKALRRIATGRHKQSILPSAWQGP
jgi:hypothetical protein